MPALTMKADVTAATNATRVSLKVFILRGCCVFCFDSAANLSPLSSLLTPHPTESLTLFFQLVFSGRTGDEIDRKGKRKVSTHWPAITTDRSTPSSPKSIFTTWARCEVLAVRLAMNERGFACRRANSQGLPGEFAKPRWDDPPLTPTDHASERLMFSGRASDGCRKNADGYAPIPRGGAGTFIVASAPHMRRGGFRRNIRSGHVTLQNGEKGRKILPRLRRISRVLDALVHVRVNYDIAKGFESPTDGRDLREYIRAIGVSFHHFLNSLHLSAHLAQTDDQRLYLPFGMDVFHVVSSSPANESTPAAKL